MSSSPGVVFVVMSILVHDVLKDADDVVHPDEVAVLVVADLPAGLVVHRQAGWDGHRLAKVYQPNVDSVVVVDKEEGAADELKHH